MNARQYASATQRNRKPILDILTKVLLPGSNVLEIASGTGEHAVFFASELKSCHWTPSDINPRARESIAAWKHARDLDNLDLPLAIDVTQENWRQQLTEQKIDAIININMLHISPWLACLGLMKGTGQILAPGGILYLYGPYKRNGEHTSPSNDTFDRSLRDRNSQWGVRDLEAVIEAAKVADFRLQQVIDMPANNLSVIFSR